MKLTEGRLARAYGRRVRQAAYVAVLLIASRSAAAQRHAAPALQRHQVVADDGHALTVWFKRPVATPRGEVVLLHGRTWSALPNFDLHVSGLHVSLMDALVARGYAVYALDQRGYGATTRDETGWLTPDRAARDAGEVLDWVAGGAPHGRRPALFGYSRGSMTALLLATRQPEKLSSLILYGLAYDVSHRRDTVPEPPAPPRANTTQTAAAEDFISPDSTPSGVKEAYVRDATMRDPVRTDWRHEEQFGAIDVAAIHTPTLAINGERDPVAKAANVPEFMSRLAGMDRAWVVLSHSDHVAHLERQQAFVNALVSFLERAAPSSR